MALTLVSCKIPQAETPVVGVTLDPYVLVRRADSGVTATADEVPEEGHSDARYSLRFRYKQMFQGTSWLNDSKSAYSDIRSTGNESAVYCFADTLSW